MKLSTSAHNTKAGSRPGKTPIRVLVVDDSLTVRRYIAQVLQSDPDIEVVGEASDGKAAIACVEELKPDVITLDIAMPVMDGLQATEHIMACHPTPIVIVSGAENRGELFPSFDALRAGAVEVVEKPGSGGMFAADPLQWERHLRFLVRVASGVAVVTRGSSQRQNCENPEDFGMTKAGHGSPRTARERRRAGGARGSLAREKAAEKAGTPPSGSQAPGLQPSIPKSSFSEFSISRSSSSKSSSSKSSSSKSSSFESASSESPNSESSLSRSPSPKSSISKSSSPQSSPLQSSRPQSTRTWRQREQSGLRSGRRSASEQVPSSESHVPKAQQRERLKDWGALDSGTPRDPKRGKGDRGTASSFAEPATDSGPGAAFSVSAGSKTARRSKSAAARGPAQPPQKPEERLRHLVALAASTGGPRLLGNILRALPASFPLPILIVIHLNQNFAAAFAAWLQTQSALPISLAKHGAPLPPPGQGAVFLAPPDHHLCLEAGHFVLDRGALRHSLRPSADLLFESLARESPRGTLAGVLTGMGSDGAAGLLALRRAGARTFAQDEDSSAVFGMPARAIALGAAQRVLPATHIAPVIKAFAYRTSPAPSPP